MLIRPQDIVQGYMWGYHPFKVGQKVTVFVCVRFFFLMELQI